MLKIIGAELEFISDIDMNLPFGKGMGRNIYYIANRCSKENNKYMKSYNDNNPSKYITYWDVNNLYGWVISQYFPYSGFKWSNQKEINGFDVNSVSENSSHGYILEVDLK